MRKPFGSFLSLGVAHDAVALVETRGRGGEHALLGEVRLDGASAFPLALGAALHALLDGAGRARWPLRVVLADELARLWQVTAPPACTRMADLEAAAALRFQQLYGEPAADWHIAADWQLKHSFIAAALPRAVLAVLQQAAAGAATPLVALTPQFMALFNCHRKAIAAGDWFGVVHDGVLTLGACDNDVLVAVRPLGIPASAGSAWLQDTLAREALRLNLAVPARLLVCGDAVPAWREAALCVRLGGEAGPASGLSAAARLAVSGART